MLPGGRRLVFSRSSSRASRSLLIASSLAKAEGQQYPTGNIANFGKVVCMEDAKWKDAYLCL